MAQFQPQVPHPVADNLPALLPPVGLAAPAVGVLLLIFIGESILKRAAMQVERHHIRRRERALRQVRQEQLVDDAGTGDPDAALFFSGRMSGHHDPAPLSCCAQRHRRTVIEDAGDAAFRMRHS